MKKTEDILEFDGNAETGEVRNQLALRHQKNLMNQINKYQNRREPYYLIHTIKKLRGDMEVFKIKFKEAWIPWTQKQFDVVWKATGGIGFINSACYRVDNKIGECRRLWIHKPDVPMIRPEVYTEENINQEIIDMFDKAQTVCTWTVK